MGGNLFRLGRLPKEKYLKIETEICSYLDTKLGQDFYRIPRYYADKPDFGDLDIIISLEKIGQNWQTIRKEISQDLGITNSKASGAVFSTVFQNFQVDYFTVQPQYFLSTYNYLSFNDLGNLIGKIFRRFNLKYGETGLAYVFRRENSHYKIDLPISTDFEKMYRFLGLDYPKWEQGFRNLPEMFDWVIESPYFFVKSYQEELAGNMAKRFTQRTTIQKFGDYLKEKKITKTYAYSENRDEYIQLVQDFFPEADLLMQIAQEKQKESIARQIQEKFNGNLVMELIPNLSGKELGIFINDFKNQFADFDTFILQTDLAEISNRILKFKSQSINNQ